jgi:solute carrier family 4 anion exchanger 2
LILAHFYSSKCLCPIQQFHKVAYKADERKELLSAINEFLDDSIVLPPGDWERKALLPFGELKAKSEMIRRRKTTRLMEADEAKKGMWLYSCAHYSNVLTTYMT